MQAVATHYYIRKWKKKKKTSIPFYFGNNFQKLFTNRYDIERETRISWKRPTTKYTIEKRNNLVFWIEKMLENGGMRPKGIYYKCLPTIWRNLSRGEKERNKTSFLYVFFVLYSVYSWAWDPNPPFNLEGIYSLDKSLFGWFMSPLVLSHRWSFMSSKGPVINRLGWTRKKKKKAPSLFFFLSFFP